MNETKKIPIVTKVLDANSRIANEIRHLFQHKNILAINLISSPGSGKTTFLETVLPILSRHKIRCGVIAADIATTRDADRLSKFEIPVLQITTETFGGACHLEAAPVRQALEVFPLDKVDLLFIENVGNLVCPAEFDIGEALRIVFLSVTEGEDKPLKYPLAFHVADCAVITKIDLIEHLKFSKQKLYDSIRKINPKLVCFEVSCFQSIGIDQFVGWLLQQHSNKSELLKHEHEHVHSAHEHKHSH
ncbi:MAG: hydrogenase nickel incorporation protein HypB [bacterium]|nr:hydrogenase nickel incorporation protein HypB [bacterium]